MTSSTRTALRRLAARALGPAAVAVALMTPTAALAQEGGTTTGSDPGASEPAEDPTSDEP